MGPIQVSLLVIVWSSVDRRRAPVERAHQQADHKGFPPTMVVQSLAYPLVNLQKTMENHYFQWENSL